MQGQQLRLWQCDVCHKKAFDTYEEAEEHEVQCRQGNVEAATLKEASSKKKKKKTIWQCDVCKEAVFDNFEGCVVHEKACAEAVAAKKVSLAGAKKKKGSRTPKAKASPTATAAKEGKKRKVLWQCDVCNEAAFANFEECAAHEKNCTATATSKTVGAGGTTTNATKKQRGRPRKQTKAPAAMAKPKSAPPLNWPKKGTLAVPVRPPPTWPKEVYHPWSKQKGRPQKGPMAMPAPPPPNWPKQFYHPWYAPHFYPPGQYNWFPPPNPNANNTTNNTNNSTAKNPKEEKNSSMSTTTNGTAQTIYYPPPLNYQPVHPSQLTRVPAGMCNFKGCQKSAQQFQLMCTDHYLLVMQKKKKEKPKDSDDGASAVEKEQKVGSDECAVEKEPKDADDEAAVEKDQEVDNDEATVEEEQKDGSDEGGKSPVDKEQKETDPDEGSISESKKVGTDGNSDGEECVNLSSQSSEKISDSDKQETRRSRSSSRAAMGPWTEDEDDQLLRLVTLHGAKKWGWISSRMPGRSNRQCNERWTDCVNPDINRGPYTTEEHRIILDFQSKNGNKWTKMAKLLPGRTANGVKNYWNSKLQKKMKKYFISCIGTEIPYDEDGRIVFDDDFEEVLEAVNKGVSDKVTDDETTRKKSRTIAKSASGEELRPWTGEEDELLKELFGAHGTNWVFISNHVPGRTSSQCEERLSYLLGNFHGKIVESAKVCKRKWCRNSAAKDGVCVGHYMDMMQSGCKFVVCQFQGCQNTARKGSMCLDHYKWVLKGVYAFESDRNAPIMHKSTGGTHSIELNNGSAANSC